MCKNYLLSDQHLREEMRRETTLAFKYRDSVTRSPDNKSANLQTQLTKIACATVAACANELEASESPTSYHKSRSSGAFEDTKRLASLKCANVQFKHRYESFLTDPRLK